MEGIENLAIRVLCPRRKLLSNPKIDENGDESRDLRWLIGSPLFLPPFTVVSSFRCLHFLNDDKDPDFQREADDIRTLLLRGFDVVGAMYICTGAWEEKSGKAVELACQLRKYLFDEEDHNMIGGTADLNTGDIHFVFGTAKSRKRKLFSSVIYEDAPEAYLWEKGCLLRCDMAFKLPIYVPTNKTSDLDGIFSSLINAAVAKFKDPHVAFLVEGTNVNSEGTSHSIVLHGEELDFSVSVPDHKSFNNNTKSNEKALACSSFCSKCERNSGENADLIHFTVLFNQSRSTSISGAPKAQYLPALDPARLLVVNFKLDVLCYASKDFPITAAISKLVVPGLLDQIVTMRKAFTQKLLAQHPQFTPYHFLLPGFLHPITTIYDLRYGETEVAQVEIRKSLHERLALPLDRPLLRIANALAFGIKGIADTNVKSSTILKDVHTEIPSSGVSGGNISLVDGSYEYYHYLLDGIDDNGWGCAYRSLQTIISWFRLQNYASLKVPSHRTTWPYNTMATDWASLHMKKGVPVEGTSWLPLIVWLNVDVL